VTHGSRIELRDVTVRYNRHIALESVSGEFASGSMTAVVGANGAGKSTLLGIIAGTIRPNHGRVLRPIDERLAYLPQVIAIDAGYPLTVSELISLGGWREFGAFKAPTAALREAVAEAAQTVGLTHRLHRRIGELSVGQFQRALFARLILQDAPLILLDEPFASVDAATIDVLLEQIERWHQQGRTVIAVLHDLRLVRMNFPDSLVLAQRCVAWGPTESTLTEMTA
jgi:zinc/manganese transport system ATP-binding protein